jgi:HEAT repeat protein
MRYTFIFGCCFVLSCHENNTQHENRAKQVAADDYVRDFEFEYEPDPAKLYKNLKNKSITARRNAALQLGYKGPPMVESGDDLRHFDAIVDALADPDPVVRYYVMYFFYVDPSGRGEAYVPRLKPLLKDADVGVRRRAAYLFCQYWSAGKEADNELKNAVIGDQDQFVRAFSAGALIHIGNPDATLFRHLIEALNADDSKNDYGGKVIYALGNLGDRAIPTVISCLKDKRQKVRLGGTGSASIIGRANRSEKGKGAHDLVAALRSTLKDPDLDVARNSIFALGCFGDQATVAVPDIIGQLKHTNGSIRLSAARNLRQFPSSAKLIIPALRKSLRDEAADVPIEAMKSIETLTKSQQGDK